ncbi:hypothetical protein ACFUC1_04285 [Pedococcus sp. NPDC057267]|uniref:hypothetical protein n=1 Tax=Pedococcus sp. NPDC057267 TaxID=3346077 RepID=UPI00363B7E76
MRSNLSRWAWIWPAVAVVAGALRISSEDGPALTGLLILPLAGYGLRQLYVRRRTRRRRGLQSGSYGLWWGRVWRAYDGGLWRRPSAMAAAFGSRSVAVSVDATTTGLTFTPGRFARWRHLGPVELAWTEIAGAHAVGSGRGMPDGTISFTTQTRVCIEVTGERVTDEFRPLTDAEAEEEGLDAEERSLLDQEALSLAQEEFGPGYRFGTRPLLFITDDPADLVELVRGRARGRVDVSAGGRA